MPPSDGENSHEPEAPAVLHNDNGSAEHSKKFSTIFYQELKTAPQDAARLREKETGVCDTSSRVISFAMA